jgi:hypothetical protein
MEERSEFKYPYVKGGDMPWADVIVPEYIIPFIERLKGEGTKPTVRGILYYLESIRVVPKNDHTYDRIKRVLGEARRGYRKRDGTRGEPTIAMDAFADNTRHIIKDFKDKERSLEDYIDDGIAHFENLPNGFRTLVPRWLDQPNYVEVWVEKDAMAENVAKALQGRHVVIAPNRGNSSITFIHNNIERLVERFDQNESTEKIWILYLGDLDPVGYNMDRLIKEDLAAQTEDEGIEDDIVFKRIGITMDQIKKHKLTNLMRTDKETMAKLWSKRRLAEAFEKEFGSVFQIELDAMQLIPNYQRLITAEVDKLYHQDVHDDVLDRPEYSQEPDEIKEQIIDALNDLIERLH